MTTPNPTPTTLRELLVAVYGCGRNSRIKLSDHEQFDTWMSVDQATQRTKLEQLFSQTKEEDIE